MAKKLTDYDHALRHHYRAEPNGPFIPGVTTILDVIAKHGLKWASSEIGARTAVEQLNNLEVIAARHRDDLRSKSYGNTPWAQKNRLIADTASDMDIYIHWCRGEFQRQWSRKADQGTRIHTVAEAWSAGEAVDVRSDDAPIVKALEQFHRDYKPKSLHPECIVANPGTAELPLPWGGRTDDIQELDGPGASGVFMVDYKTGSPWDSELACQMIGYMRAMIVDYDLETGAMLPLKPLPALDGARGIYLSRTGLVVKDAFEVVTQDQAWRTFKAARELYEMQSQIEAAIKERQKNQ
jgi:hypothetical protein